MSTKVSVIIPTCTSGFTYITRLLPSIAEECKNNDSEIIIVDNNSKDGTTNFLANYNCKIIVNNFNNNFSKSNNQAARIAEGEYLLLLNNDTVMTPGTLGEMLKVFTDDSIGIVGCLLLRASDSKVQHAGIYFTQDYIPYDLGLETPGFSPEIPRGDDRVNSIHEVPAITGACLMIRKSLYQQLGGLDEAYVNGWEDTDLCLRARELGYKIWYTGKGIVYHVNHGSSQRGRFAYEEKNRLRYEALWLPDRIRKLQGIR